MSILVTGGAGYIGSHTVAELAAQGELVVVVDHLGKGHREAVFDHPFYAVDIHDEPQLRDIIRQHEVDTVVHFAADSLVGESVTQPLQYYRNNVEGTRSLLSAMSDCGVQRIVFSSTAAVYGEPEHVPISEADPVRPTNPYGETKAAIERMLYWALQAYGTKSVSLRYFNAAGAHPTLPLGERHDPETHLIPIVLQAASGTRGTVTVYGNDYATPDGTCIRDYVHVMDLAAAHVLAVRRLRDVTDTAGCEVFNLGIGRGFSVQEVIDAARRVTGCEIPTVQGSRRAGDPAVLVAAPDRAMQVLNWSPVHRDVESMIASAWAFVQSTTQD